MALTTFYYSDRSPTTSSNTIITSSSRPAGTTSVLIEVIIGDTVTSISDNAFDTCENLLSVGFILPSVLTTIGYQAFADCFALEEINLPDSVTTIGGEAFNGTNINSFYVSANLITIGDLAFAAAKIGNFIVDNNNPNYSNGSLGELFNKNKTTLIKYANKRIDNSYTIPDSVTTIVTQALQISNNLTRINVTNNITIIPPYSFSFCANLTEIYIGKGVTDIGFNTFYNCTNLIKVIFIGNAPSLGADVFLNTNANLKVYRYSIRSGWSSTLGGKDVLLIDTPSKGLKTFGFNGISSGKISIKKQNLGGGKLTAQRTILQLWLKSDAGVILDGSDVIEWKDQSGHSRNFTKSINRTKAPTFSNGALLFTATSTYNDSNASVLALPSSSLNFRTPYTLITVVRAGANNSCVFSKSNDDSKRRKYQISVNGGIIYSIESKNGDTNIEYNTGTGNNVNIKRLIVSQYSSNTSGLIRYNGNQVATSEEEIDVGIDQTNTASVFIGASPFGEGTGYNAEASTEMYVYEILFYNQALSTVEIQQIETYLNNKYSIY